jgi:hypothetical protein
MPSPFRPTPILLAVLAASALIAQSPPADPLPSEITESVEVRLVPVDVIALTESDETVPDMIQEDFELFVDGKRTPIDNLDVFCSAGAEADPTSMRFGAWPTPPDLTDGTRRIVLAFDYLNLARMGRTAALQDYQWMLKAKTGIADEEMMVVALTGGIRVEQPFTRDRAEIVKTLHRMEHDITLWNGNFSHLTAFPLWASLRALVSVLRTTPGPKAVVYITAGWGPSSNRYDNEWGAALNFDGPDAMPVRDYDENTIECHTSGEEVPKERRVYIRVEPHEGEVGRQNNQHARTNRRNPARTQKITAICPIELASPWISPRVHLLVNRSASPPA